MMGDGTGRKVSETYDRPYLRETQIAEEKTQVERTKKHRGQKFKKEDIGMGI